MTVYSVKLETLSPVHIGNGKTLKRDFDFVTHGNITYCLNVDLILREKEDQWKNNKGSYPLPGKLLRADEYKNFSRYTMRGIPRSVLSNAEVKSFIKDVYDYPYIPGSSLKGALRTALAWNGWNEVKPKLNRNAIGHRRSWAGQRLEKKIFGRDPNHDLLRALQVSDMMQEKKKDKGLILVNAQVLTQNDAGSPIELEALKAGISLQGSIKIDDALFEDWAEDKLHFQNRKHWLYELIPRVNAHTQNRIDPLINWFNDAGITKIAKFYTQVRDAKVGSHQAIFQLGWGGGWDSKTFGSHLKKNEHLFKKLLSDFRMRKGHGPIKDFPVSKRLVVKDDGTNIYPLAPFGWVLMTMEEKQR